MSARYAETWGKLMSIPPAVPLNWFSRAKIRIAPIDDGVVADEQKTIDLYFRAGLIKQKLNAAEIVDRSFSGAIGKGAGLRSKGGKVLTPLAKAAGFSPDAPYFGM